MSTATTKFTFNHWPLIYDDIIPIRLREVNIPKKSLYVNEITIKNALGFVEYNTRCEAEGREINPQWIEETKDWADLRLKHFTEQLDTYKQQQKVLMCDLVKEQIKGLIDYYEYHAEKSKYKYYFFLYNELYCENKLDPPIDDIRLGKPNSYFNNGDFRVTSMNINTEALNILQNKYKFPERYILQLIERDCWKLLEGKHPLTQPEL